MTDLKKHYLLASSSAFSLMILNDAAQELSTPLGNHNFAYYQL